MRGTRRMEDESFLFEVKKYCEKYNIPVSNLMEILEDQKVVPMIRGKATEINAYILLSDSLDSKEWTVHKLNLNPQPNSEDQDISLVNKRTGIALKVECKNATRGSFRSGKGRTKIKEPHFTVKCHRSRSNVKLATTTNDKYSVDCFDFVITNSSNAIIKGNTIGSTFQLINEPDLLKILQDHYGATSEIDLLRCAYSDWRFCVCTEIAVDGFLPRTPVVRLKNDPKWRPISEMEKTAIKLVEQRRAIKR